MFSKVQLRFWQDPQPLVERLGREFFRRLPEKPGVYLMRGAGEIVLYVGKAKNLRHRLGSYRVANPDRMPRRTLRLMSLVESIGWEECESESAALRRESELLLALKPRFNRAGVWPGPRRFVAWRPVAEGLEVAVADSALESWTCAGPFGAQAFRLHRALVRLLWCGLHPQAGLVEMPVGWMQGMHGARVVLAYQDAGLITEVCQHLTRLARGESGSFSEWLPPVTAPFEQPLRDEDVELVAEQLGTRGLVGQG